MKKSPFLIIFIEGILSVILGFVGEAYYSLNYVGTGAYAYDFEFALWNSMKSTQFLNTLCIVLGAILIVLAIFLKALKVKFEKNSVISIGIVIGIVILIIFIIPTINAYNYFSAT